MKDNSEMTKEELIALGWVKNPLDKMQEKTEKQLTAVEWFAKQVLRSRQLGFISNEKFNELLEQAKEMEDSQATDYAKWSMDINQLTGHFFTFREWIKDEPKDDETSKQE